MFYKIIIKKVIQTTSVFVPENKHVFHIYSQVFLKLKNMGNEETQLAIKGTTPYFLEPPLVFSVFDNAA